MTPAGQALIDKAKADGTWTIMDEVEKGVIPLDLASALKKNKKAGANFQAFPPSSKRIILGWIMDAKTPETRSKRIKETVKLAAKNVRANHYQPKK
jgi:uncharacterized protein YdeI (YjbR/CyaY-like superfamily)